MCYANILETQKFNKIKIKTEPYPGFPTDLQAQIMVLMTLLIPALLAYFTHLIQVHSPSHV